MKQLKISFYKSLYFLMGASTVLALWLLVEKEYLLANLTFMAWLTTVLISIKIKIHTP